MAFEVHVGDSPTLFKSGTAGKKYVLTGLSGGVQNDGGESWSITLEMQNADMPALKEQLFLGRPINDVVSGFALPSKNTNCWITGWSFAYKKGEIIECTINAGILTGTTVTYSSGTRTEEEWSIETIEDEIPLVEVAGYWTRMPITNNATNRAKVFAVATALANIEFNGLLPERGAQWQATARTLLGSSSLTADTFRSNIPPDLLARIQTGNITLKLGALHVSRRLTSTTNPSLMSVGTSDTPSSTAIKIPSNLTGEVVSDSASYSSVTGYYTRTTVWKLSRKTDS